MRAKNLFLLLIVLIIASSAVYSQSIFRLIDPLDRDARYGKSPYSDLPFLYFGSASYTYKISSARYSAHLRIQVITLISEF